MTRKTFCLVLALYCIQSRETLSPVLASMAKTKMAFAETVQPTR